MATHWKEGLGLAALSLALTLMACGGDGEAKPPKDAGRFIPDDEEEDAGDDADDAEVTDESDAGSDAGIEEETLQASAAEAATKGWVEGCYKKPKTNKELLNSCAKAWRKFDKTLYPASWKEGEALPALP